MEPSYAKHCLEMLFSDLDRDSIKFLRHELESIIEEQQRQLDNHGKYLVSTPEEKLPELKAAALINKARLEATQHLAEFLKEDYLLKVIENLKNVIQERKKGENNE